MGFFSGIARTIMFVFNFACLLVGLVLIIVGAIFYVSVDEYYKVIDGVEGLNVVPSVTIAVGCIVFLISFLGCWGALKNNNCMLTTYAIILIILLVIQLVIGIYGLIYIKDSKEDLQPDIVKAMNKAFTNYNQTAVKDIFNSMQSELECCGVTEPSDYQTLINPPWPSSEFPGACCGKPNEKICSLSDQLHTTGCADALYDTIYNAIQVVAIVALVICAIELLGAVFAICLVRSS